MPTPEFLKSAMHGNGLKHSKAINIDTLHIINGPWINGARPHFPLNVGPAMTSEGIFFVPRDDNGIIAFVSGLL